MNPQRIIYLIISLFLSVSPVSCKKSLKHTKDYYPGVAVTSYTVLEDGTVKLRGRILDNGYGPIGDVGFCSDTLPDPSIDVNQAIATINGEYFEAIAPGLSEGHRYYIRPWAVNDYGYNCGETYFIDSLVFPPVTTPCTPDVNSLYLNGDHYFSDVQPIKKGALTTWEVTASVYDLSGSTELEFSSYPSTGLFTTASPGSVNDPSERKVFISISQYVLDFGAPIYVQKKAGGWEVSFCNAHASKYGGPSYYITGKIFCPE